MTEIFFFLEKEESWSFDKFSLIHDPPKGIRASYLEQWNTRFGQLLIIFPVCFAG